MRKYKIYNIFFVHVKMRITKFMKRNKIVVSLFLILVMLFHSSGITEKIFGMTKKSEEEEGSIIELLLKKK